MTRPVHQARVPFELVGAPDWVPRVVHVDPVQLTKGRLKIRFKAGRNDFVYDCHVRPVHGRRALFVLCGHAVLGGVDGQTTLSSRLSLPTRMPT